jgi:hypothetical protein
LTTTVPRIDQSCSSAEPFGGTKLRSNVAAGAARLSTIRRRSHGKVHGRIPGEREQQYLANVA